MKIGSKIGSSSYPNTSNDTIEILSTPVQKSYNENEASDKDEIIILDSADDSEDISSF